MITSVGQTRKKGGGEPSIGKVRSYGEITEYLESLKAYEYNDEAPRRMKQLDALLDHPSSKLDIILVGGTNGKSSTIHFAQKLLKEEGFKVAASYSTNLLTFNERITADFQTIGNKAFTDILNEIITITETHSITATSYEILSLAAIKNALAEKVDLILMEVAYGGLKDALNAFTPKIAAITRIAEDQKGLLGTDLDLAALEMMAIAKKDCWFISAEQSKLRLQKMKHWVDTHGILWAMPIRKLASLPYIYEQLHGRTASLGERIAQLYVEDIKGKFSPFLRGNLLATQKGQRGRPTLEAKRQAELHPIKTLKGFWVEQFDLLRGRFELLDKEKPSILLDNAANLDALKNLFLGIRLVHYQKPLKGLAIIIGLSKAVDAMEALKLMRYLLKKVSGNVFFVPLPDSDITSHDVQDLMLIAKELNIKAKDCKDFTDAFERAKGAIDERDGLMCITGSNSMVREYWNHRGIKKL